MTDLPPLRTVRDPKASPSPVPAPAPAAPIPAAVLFSPSRTPAPVAVPAVRIPAAAAKVVADLQTAGLLGPNALGELAARVGPHAAYLTQPDRVLDALETHKFITAYQRTRVETGNAFGLLLGNYLIQDRVGGGSVGIVFRAVHRTLGRLAAVKVIPDDGATHPDVLSRFRSEAGMLAKLDHPHLTRVYDAGTLADAHQTPLHYLIVEYLPGGDLEEHVCEKGALAPATACEFGRQAASALAAAHAAGLTHRDVKPSNLLLSADGLLKVADFGLAREFGSVRTPRPGLLGSVEFMPPEQTVDPSTVGPAADVYALGATLFWLLTGQLPYERRTTASEALQQIRSEPPKALAAVRKDVPFELNQLVSKMMRRSPGDRPDMLEVAGVLSVIAAKEQDPAALARAAQNAAAAMRAQRDDANLAVLECLAAAARARGEPAGLQRRVAGYVRALSRKLAGHKDWPMLADPNTVELYALCAAARNCGLVTIPDAAMTDPGPMTPQRQAILDAHAADGAAYIDAVAAAGGAGLPVLRTVRAAVRSHHEHWDGTGFPDKLTRDQIPPVARLIALADAYDAGRDPLATDPVADHQGAAYALVKAWTAHFDPVVLNAFKAAADDFAAVYLSTPD